MTDFLYDWLLKLRIIFCHLVKYNSILASHVWLHIYYLQVKREKKGEKEEWESLFWGENCLSITSCTYGTFLSEGCRLLYVIGKREAIWLAIETIGLFVDIESQVKKNIVQAERERWGYTVLHIRLLMILPYDIKSCFWVGGSKEKGQNSIQKDDTVCTRDSTSRMWKAEHNWRIELNKYLLVAVW